MVKYLVFLTFFASNLCFANVAGSDLQNFNPTSNGLDFITVQSSRTLEPLEFNLGSFVTYSTNTLPYAIDANAPNNQTFTDTNDRHLYSFLHFGLGIMKGWDFGINAVFLNTQDVEQSNNLINYGDSGIDDIRLNTKVRVLKGPDWGFALLAGVDFDQIQNNPFAGENAGPSINLEGAIDIYLTPAWLWSVNLGYRIRQKGTTIPNTGIEPISNQVIYSSAMAYETNKKGSAVIFELFGSYPVESFTLPTDRQTSNLETVLGYRWRAIENLDIHGGLGTEIYHGLGTPDFRAFLGLNFRLGFLQKKSNEQKYKFSDAEKYRSDQPKILQKTMNKDSDGDGVRDQDDRCKNTPEGVSVNGYGCEVKDY